MKRALLLGIAMILGISAPAGAQVNVGIGIRGSGFDIGIHLSSYPDLVPVPGYPVYYHPRGDLNYFFYDGLYWVFADDNWYASSWYDGPWDLIDPYYVPLYVLRIPVRYYRRPPAYFRGWKSDAPPHWDEHWGREWSSRRARWDQWDRRAVPPPAPLPSYQRPYAGDRYPRAPEVRQSIRSNSYRYEPREQLTQQYWQRERASGGARVEQQRPQARPPEQRPDASRPEPQGRDRDNAARPQEKGRKNDPESNKGREDKHDDDRDRGRR